MNTQRVASIFCVLLFSLLLSGCSSRQIFAPTFTPTPSITPTPTSTQTLTPTFTATPKPSATSTPEATAKSEIELVDCTSEDFLEHKIPAYLIVDKTLYSLEKQNSKPFDLSKIRVDVPLINTSARIANSPIHEITYWGIPRILPPYFSAEGSKPFRRHLRGFTEYQGNIYAIITLELNDLQNLDENAIMIGLYKFNSRQNTNEIKKTIIAVMETRMETVPLISVNLAPDTNEPDPLIEAAGTFNIPDIEDRIARFTNNNGYDSNGVWSKKPLAVKDSGGEEDHSALDGLVFLTNIYDIKDALNPYK